MNPMWHLEQELSPSPDLALPPVTGSRADQARELLKRCEEREKRFLENAIRAERDGDHEATWFAMAGRAENTRLMDKLKAYLNEHGNSQLSGGTSAPTISSK